MRYSGALAVISGPFSDRHWVSPVPGDRAPSNLLLLAVGTAMCDKDKEAGTVNLEGVQSSCRVDSCEDFLEISCIGTGVG
jgi:hypothetical protein